MKNKNADLFKKYIKDYSTKEQKPFAGLARDLKIKYKTNSATGNDIMELLQQLSAGAEADTIDGLKTRLVRLDKLREFLLKSELKGQEQKTVYTAYTKVQTAIRKRKDEYTKKYTVLKDIIKDAGSNIAQATFQASEDLPQLRIAMTIGGGLFKHIKKYQEEKKQKLKERNEELKRDSELYYSRELLRGTNKSVGKNKLQRDKRQRQSTRFKTPEESLYNIEGAVVNDNLARQYDSRPRSLNGVGKNQSPEAVILKGIASDVKIIAGYYKGKLIRDKDQKMDDLESLREGTKLKLFGGKDKDKEKDPIKKPGILNSIMKSVYSAIGTALEGIIGVWAMTKLRNLPTLIKNVLKNPSILKEVPGKAWDMAKALPGKSWELIKSIPGRIWPGAGGGAKTAEAAGASGASQEFAERILKGTPSERLLTEGAEKAVTSKAAEKVLEKSIGKRILGRIMPYLGTLLAASAAKEDMEKGEYGHAVLDGLSAFPIVGWPALGLRLLSGYYREPFDPNNKDTDETIDKLTENYAPFVGQFDGVDKIPTKEEFDKKYKRMTQINPRGQELYEMMLDDWEKMHSTGMSPTGQALKREVSMSDVADVSAQKTLIKQTLDNEGKADPGSVPAAIVPVAKIGKTSDLKDILQSDANGLGFLFSLKGIDKGELINAMLGQGSQPAVTQTSYSGGSAPIISDGVYRPSSGSSGGSSNSGSSNNSDISGGISNGRASGAASLSGGLRRDIPGIRGPAPSPGQGNSALSNTAKLLRDQKMETAISSGEGRSACVWAVNQVFDKAGVPQPWTNGTKSIDTAQKGLKQNGWVPISENDRQPGDVWIANNGSGQRHIGIVGDDGKIINNSSNNGAFTNSMDPNSLRKWWGQGQYYRMPKGWVESGGKPGGDPSIPDAMGADPGLSQDTTSGAAKALGAPSNASSSGSAGAPGASGAGAAQPKAMPQADILGKSTSSDKQSAREKAIEEWHMSDDPNKGTASEYLKSKGLVEESEPSGGVEGVDYTVDPDNGEKLYFDEEYKQAKAKLTPDTKEPEMSESIRRIKEQSEKTAAAQATGGQSTGPISVHNDNRSSPAPSSQGSNQGSGAAKEWQPSWERANDLVDV